jgi:hypothetical protein
MVSQLFPSFVVRNTLFPATYSTLLSCGENTIGYVHWKRTSAVLPSWYGSGHTLTSRTCLVVWS